MVTTLFGICVVDIYHGYKFHCGTRHRHKCLSLTEFVQLLAKDCLENSFSQDIPDEPALTIDLDMGKNTNILDNFTTFESDKKWLQLDKTLFSVR